MGRRGEARLDRGHPLQSGKGKAALFRQEILSQEPACSRSPDGH
ncbi:MAG: hypothetical protein ACM335_10135 [Deltaproteobacteria bacterium]